MKRIFPFVSSVCLLIGAYLSFSRGQIEFAVLIAVLFLLSIPLYFGRKRTP